MKACTSRYRMRHPPVTLEQIKEIFPPFKHKATRGRHTTVYPLEEYGRLKVLYRTVGKGHKASWVCKCQCGIYCVVRGDNLTNGNTASCGCASAGRRVVRNDAQR